MNARELQKAFKKRTLDACEYWMHEQIITSETNPSNERLEENAPDIFTVYRVLGFHSELSFQVLGQIVDEHVEKNYEPTFTTISQFIDFLKSIDGNNGLEGVKESISTHIELEQKLSPFYRTDMERSYSKDLIESLRSLEKILLKKLSDPENLAIEELQDRRLYHNLSEIREKSFWANFKVITTEEVVDNKPIECPVVDVPPEKVIFDIGEVK